jgi:hypothetical protein
LATANFVGGSASVLLNKGNGTFRPATSYLTGHPKAPYGIAAARLDPRSKPSLAVATTAGTFILVNQGDGSFRATPGYDPPALQIVTMDLNNDGKADLILAGDYSQNGTGGLTVLFGKGHGVFGSTASYVAVPNLEAVATGDFNNDGKPDLAVLDANDRRLAIMLGQGKGRFSAPVHYYNAPGYPVAIAAADFNHDGKLDLAVVETQLNQVQMYLGNGDGSFTTGASFGLKGHSPEWITTADFNGDGIPDLAVTSLPDDAGKGAISILLGRGNGTFRAVVGYGSVQYQWELAVADFNHDGKLDFAAADYTNNAVDIFFGDGNGKFKKKGTYPAGTHPIGLATADFNNDGNWDLATVNHGASFAVMLGKGDGSFGTPNTGPLPWESYSLRAADFDGDGNADLVALTLQYGQVYLLRNKGDGTFGQAISSNIGTTSHDITVADLNGDGALDLAVPNYDGGEVSVLLNRCAK